jgi:chromosome segregation ATPase
MEYYICKRTEDEFKQIFSDKLVSLETERSNLESDLKNVKEKYAEKNGFTDESKNILKTIDKKFLELKFYSYLESENIFNELDKNIIILKNYYNKYNPKILFDKPDYTYKQIKQHSEITINDILGHYLLEPIEERYKSIKTEIENKINSIDPYIKKIKETKNFFFEIDVKLNTLYQELIPGGWHETSSYNSLEPNIFKYTLSNKICLCPYCAAMFNGASTASFSLKMAEEQKRMDDDWD